MIKGNELRIGNNVNFQQYGEVEVSHVNEELCGVRVREKDIWGKVSKITLSVGPEHLTAIRLSPTVLERCGFECKKNSVSSVDCRHKEIDIELRLNDDGGYSFLGSEWPHGISNFYLHQLQNLVFALTGQELKMSES